ncbi:MAG: hypothetical protein QW051_05020 [Candidatus Aenigmatarchaeota archaeon]
MSKKLSQLYKRFGLEFSEEKVEKIFRTKIENILVDGELGNKIFEKENNIPWLICLKFGEIYEDHIFRDKEYTHILGNHLSFEEFLMRIQYIIDVLWENKKTKHLAIELANFISESIDELPKSLLGIKVIFYKTKSPQIIPTSYQKFEKEVMDTLGVLELNKKFEPIISSYERGLKEFFSAKDKEGYKDAIEDMYTAVDNLVKIITRDRNKGFKHVSEKEVAQVLKVNGHQKEMYKNLREWMDRIKHGSCIDFDKVDVEMIISCISALIRYVIIKTCPEK